VRRPKLSIPRRVFLAFALVLTVSGLVSVASFVQHQRTAATLSLVHEGYLPLALTISEARATQSVFGNLLDRVLTERNPDATRAWLNAARKARPAMYEQMSEGVAVIERMAPTAGDRSTMSTLRREIRRAQNMVEEGEQRYAQLNGSLDSSDKLASERILADLRARERGIDSRLRLVWTLTLSRITATSQRAANEQQRALTTLAVLGVLSLLVGIVVTFWSQRVLSPLPELQARVEAVARGDFARKIGPNTDDEIGQLGREFERMVAALEARDAKLIQSERLAAIGRMAAHVTHEVRNPLSSIGLNVELLEEELPEANVEARELLRAIQREIEHLTALTEEYLRVARLPNPHLEPEAIADVVTNTISFMRPELSAAGVEVRLDVEADLPWVALDEAQIRQVLINLIKNARDAMPDGGTITVQLARDTAGVVMRVIDQGEGMTPEQRERIFDLFYTTKSHGTGLGLPLSQQIVVAHGGMIRCQSAVGEGTTFELSFPAASDARSVGRAPAEH
jgi:two-component system NtrC family sensor kinase